MKRWLSTSEVGDLLAERSPRIAKLTRWERARYARRLVERAERLEGVRCSKREGRLLKVSVNAMAYLLPPDEATVDRLDAEFGKLTQTVRAVKRQVNGHGAQLAQHHRRLKIVEEKARLIAECQAAIAALDTTP